jgi:hypothetical protein
VGQLNHKPFLLAIVYFWIAGLVVLIFHIWRFTMVSRALVWTIPSLVIFSVTFFCIILHWASLSFMAYLQLYLLFKGMTQVEYHCCKGKAYGCHFDRGLYENVRAVCGNDYRFWFLPSPKFSVSDLNLRLFVASIPRPLPQESQRPTEGLSVNHWASDYGTSDPTAQDAATQIEGSGQPESNSVAWMQRATKFDGGAFDWVQHSGGEGN